MSGDDKDLKVDSYQEQAISQNGNALIEAGAGSGKTFIIIQHLLKKLSEIVQKSLDEKDLEKSGENIKRKISEIVVMTFTNKAADEIKMRLLNNLKSIQHQTSSDEEKETWNIVIENLHYLFLGTIHGFCMKLIKRNYFPFYINTQVMTQLEYSVFVNELIKDFLVLNKEGKYKDIIGQFILNEEEVTNSFLRILNDSKKRIIWKNPEYLQKNGNELIAAINTTLKNSIFRQVFNSEFDITLYEKFADKGWFQFIEHFERFKVADIKSQKDYEGYLDFFKSYNRLRGPSKKLGLREVEDYLDEVKKFKKFMVTHQDDFMCFFNQEKLFFRYSKFLQELHGFIEERSLEKSGVTFSDLEFYTWLALSDKKDFQKVVNVDFKYFIIDEFQDISKSQYVIVNQIVRNDLNRAYFVGDVKQAIYSFRGGDVDVYMDVRQKIKNIVPLKYNYRTSKKIVEFNNHFFDYFFLNGQKNSSKKISYVKQWPNEKSLDKSGRVKKIIPYFEEKQFNHKLSPKEINYYEAISIVSYIKKNIDIIKNESLCILYKGLNASKFLINELIKNDISFVAQTKIPQLEDPVIGLFFSLLDSYMTFVKKVERINYAHFIISAYFHFLKIKKDPSLNEKIEEFYRDLDYWGIKISFEKFLYATTISFENHAQNMNLINAILSSGKGNLEETYKLLKKYSEESMSLDLEFNASVKTKIKIMSVHSSKGLEFDHCVMAGIYTNGRKKNDHGQIGADPFSFKWNILDAKGLEKTYKTPFHLFENEEEKLKNEAENLRLLYVAFTRCKFKLTWVDLNHLGSALPSVKGSWIHYINDFYHHSDQYVDQERIDLENLDRVEKSDIHMRPLFHRHNFGHHVKEDESDFLLTILPELSVTRMTYALDCPKKFYLHNICRLEDDDFLNDKSHSIENKNEISSKERGTKIHKFISKMISTKINLLEFHDLKLSQDIKKWISDFLTERQVNHRLYSEKELKFLFFNIMVTGIPDLISIPQNKEENYIISDFKTGKLKTNQFEEKYWFQVYTYAYACYVLEITPYHSKTVLELIYLDEKKTLTQTLSYEEIKSNLYKIYQTFFDLNKVNKDHCHLCDYSQVCL